MVWDMESGLLWLVNFMRDVTTDIDDEEVTEGQLKAEQPDVRAVQEAATSVQRAVYRLVNDTRALADGKSLPPYELSTTVVGLKSTIRDLVQSLTEAGIFSDDSYRPLVINDAIQGIYFERMSPLFSPTSLEELRRFIEDSDKPTLGHLADILEQHAEMIRSEVKILVSRLESWPRRRHET